MGDEKNSKDNTSVDDKEVTLKEGLEESTGRETTPPPTGEKKSTESKDVIEKDTEKSEKSDSLFKAPDSKMVIGAAAAALFLGILLAPVAPMLAVPLIVGAGLGIASQVVDRDVAFSKAKDAKDFAVEKAGDAKGAIEEKATEIGQEIQKTAKETTTSVKETAAEVKHSIEGVITGRETNKFPAYTISDISPKKSTGTKVSTPDQEFSKEEAEKGAPKPQSNER